MKKLFTPYDEIRNESFRLARKIWEDGFNPDIIYTLLRGGSYLGNILDEWFKAVNGKKRAILYAGVVAQSYENIHTQADISIKGWTYPPEKLRNGEKILLVDDIFDSGKTINRLVSILLEAGVPRRDIRIAVYDYKVFDGAATQPIQPDYWCRKHEVHSEEDNYWIHYMTHDLIGLTEEEMDRFYFSSYPELKETFKGVFF